MPLIEIPIGAEVVKDDPAYSAEGQVVDSDYMRVRRAAADLPLRWEKIGGFAKVISTQFTGKCRGITTWRDVEGDAYIALGTHQKLYAIVGNTQYDITPTGFAGGPEYGLSSAGWGAGSWGGSQSWGDPFTGGVAPLTWSLAQWGELLLASPKGGTIYVWDTNVSNIATEATAAPDNINYMFVTQERFAVAAGTNDNPTTVYWSDQNDYTVWTATATNLARSFPLGGAAIVAGCVSKGQNLIWTNEALHAMRYLGDTEFVFGFDVLGTNCGLIGPNAWAEKDGIAFWMGNNQQFYVYDGGSPRALRCPVRKFVFDAVVNSNREAIYCGLVSRFHEVWWFYPTDSDEPELDRCVVYNYAEDKWFIGSLARTAWVDSGVFQYPVAASASGYSFFHEFNYNAESSAISAFLELAPFDIADGDNVMKIRRVVPDILTTATGNITVNLYTRRWPNESAEQTKTLTYNSGTKKLDTRAEGRQARLKFSTSALGLFFRIGKVRAEIFEGGKR